VIVDVDREDMFERFVSMSKKSRQEIEYYYFNSPTRHLFESGKLSPKHYYREFVRELEMDMDFNEFREAYCNIFSLNKNVAETIRKLKKRFRLVMLSNTDILHFAYIKNKFAIVNIFDDYVLSYKVGCRKPNPLIFLKAIKKAKAMPFNCAYFDDIPNFVYVARLMGISAFQFKGYEKLREDLKKIKVL